MTRLSTALSEKPRRSLRISDDRIKGPSVPPWVVSVHQIAPADRRVWSHTAVVFATAYATLISLVHYVQLTLVAPRLARDQMAGIEVFRFVPFDSFLYAVAILGYTFMSVATFFAAKAFTGPGLPRLARWFLTANGMLIPFLALQMYVHSLIWVAALWAVTFPASTWVLARLFHHYHGRTE